jgi:hypothetical protein
MTINTVAPMFEDETRLRNLSSRAIEGAITDEEFAELMQLSKVKRKALEDKVNFLAGIKDTLAKHAITIHDLFSPAEIADAVQSSRKGVAGETARRSKGYKPGSRAARFQFKSGPVLIEIAVNGKRGVSCRYCLGQRLPTYVSKSFKLLDDGQLEANLAHYYTVQGQVYFATAEGGAELARLLGYIKTHPVKPELR